MPTEDSSWEVFIPMMAELEEELNKKSKAREHKIRGSLCYAKSISDNCWGIIFTFLGVSEHSCLGTTCKWLRQVGLKPFSFAEDYKIGVNYQEVKYLTDRSARIKSLKFFWTNTMEENTSILDGLKNLPKLQALNLTFCKITDAGLMHYFEITRESANAEPIKV